MRKLSIKSSAGFTMTELLVVMMLGSIITASITAVFVQQTRAMALQEDLVNLEENLRAAMGILHRDIRTTGLGLFDPGQSFFVGNVDINSDGVPDGDVNNHYYTNNPLASDHGNQIFKPDALMIKYSHPEEDGILINSYNGSASNMQVCGPSGLSDGDVVRIVTPTSPPEIRAIEITSFNSTCNDAACPGNDCDKIVFAVGPSEFNTSGGLAGLYSGGSIMLTTSIYYVGVDADGSPAMFRVNNFQTPHSIIAFNIVDFQVEYGVLGVDAGGSTVVNYSSSPGTIQDVAMVKVSLTGQTRNPHSMSSAPGQRPQRTISTEIQVRNLFY